MALLFRLAPLLAFVALARAESSAYAITGNGEAGPYELVIRGVGEPSRDGGYAQWRVEGRVNGATVRQTISDAQFRAGYAGQGYVIKKAALESMKSRGTALDNVMNAGRAAGVSAAQHYADRVAPKEYQLPPTRNKGSVIIGGNAGAHALQTAQEIGAEMFRAMVARKAYERDQAASLGFENVGKYKSFLGQNGSRIRAAANAGSEDPVGDVMAERDAAKAAREEISARANAEAHRVLDLGSPEERIAAAAGTSDAQQKYLNAMGVKSAAQHDAEVRRSLEGFKQRRQAEADARNPVNRVRKMREVLLAAVQSAAAKGDRMVVADYEPMVLVISEATQLQDSFRGLARLPRPRTDSATVSEALKGHLEVIVNRRLTDVVPITQGNLDETLAVLDALEAVAGMDLIY